MSWFREHIMGAHERFTHIDSPMKKMATLLRQGRYAEEIMQAAPLS